jgi:hypothetical protein
VTTWTEFAKAAPRISGIFLRRHAATGNLCLLGTTRADGFPRISPLEPRIFEGELWLVGMPGTRKFRDLLRDPRFCLHTATVDTEVTAGDAKLWGTVRDVRDEEVRRRWLQSLYEESGLDFRNETFDTFFAAGITAASAVEVGAGQMDVHIWQAGEPERTVRKH